MALRIGFTDKYYTLWDVNQRDETVGTPENWTTYTTTIRTYLQNLSMDEATAIAKAKKMGCEFLTPDHDLYGVTQSWQTRDVKESYSSPEFYKFGRNQGLRIDSTKESEIDYLLWYLAEQRYETEKEHISYIRKFLVEKHNFVNILGKTPNETESIFRTKEEAKVALETETLHYIKEDFRESCFSKNVFVGEMRKNVDYDANGVLFVTNENGVEVELTIQFADRSHNSYNGYDYFLPIDGKGKSKRVKNKTIEVHGEWGICDEYGHKLFKVKDFKVLKKSS